METLSYFPKIAIKIIKEQELIIGPLAWEEAKEVSGFHIVNKESGDVSFDGDAKEVLNRLVEKYERIFGLASHEVCREAVQDLITQMPPEEVPSSLK